MNAFTVPAIGLLLCVTSCSRLGTERSYAVVGDTSAAVRAAFNAATGKVRVVMVVSPTCGECLEGASEVSQQVAGINQARRFRSTCYGYREAAAKKRMFQTQHALLQMLRPTSFGMATIYSVSNTGRCLAGVATRGMCIWSMVRKHNGTAICRPFPIFLCTRLPRRVRSSMPPYSERS